MQIAKKLLLIFLTAILLIFSGTVSAAANTADEAVTDIGTDNEFMGESAAESRSGASSAASLALAEYNHAVEETESKTYNERIEFSGDNNVIYTRYYNMTGNSWGDIFLSWLYSNSGYPMKIYGMNAALRNLDSAAWYEYPDVTVFGGNEYAPQAGDVLVFCDADLNEKYAGIIIDTGEDNITIVCGDRDDTIELKTIDSTNVEEFDTAVIWDMNDAVLSALAEYAPYTPDNADNNMRYGLGLSDDSQPETSEDSGDEDQEDNKELPFDPEDSSAMSTSEKQLIGYSRGDQDLSMQLNSAVIGVWVRSQDNIRELIQETDYAVHEDDPTTMDLFSSTLNGWPDGCYELYIEDADETVYDFFVYVSGGTQVLSSETPDATDPPLPDTDAEEELAAEGRLQEVLPAESEDDGGGHAGTAWLIIPAVILTAAIAVIIFRKTRKK